MKRVLSWVFAIVFMMQVLCLSAFANGFLVETVAVEQEFFEESSPVRQSLSDLVEDVEGFRNRIIEGASLFSEFVVISDLELKNLESVRESIGWYVYKEIPELFHVESISFSYYPSSQILYCINFTYSYTPDDYNRMLADCAEKAQTMLADLTHNENLNDAEKALVLHDRLALLCEYDFHSGKNRYDMYGAFVDGVAVCEGYTKAYSYLLNCLGIENYFCASTLLMHAWNIVIIDGESYHVDVTWDDATPDRLGFVGHDNFLRSTVGMIETGHVRNQTVDYDQTPTSTLYDDCYWQNSDSAFQVVGEGLVYINHISETLCYRENGEEMELLSVENVWSASDDSFWMGNYSRLASFCQSLFFSQPDGIYVYRMADGSCETVFRPELDAASYESVYGFRLIDGVFELSLASSPDVGTSDSAVSQWAYVESEKDHVYSDSSDTDCNGCGATREIAQHLAGDVNGDGSVTSEDAIYLLYHCVFPSRYPLNGFCDFNADGSLTSEDAIYLLYHCVFPSRYPLSA